MLVQQQINTWKIDRRLRAWFVTVTQTGQRCCMLGCMLGRGRESTGMHVGQRCAAERRARRDGWEGDWWIIFPSVTCWGDTPLGCVWYGPKGGGWAPSCKQPCLIHLARLGAWTRACISPSPASHETLLGFVFSRPGSLRAHAGDLGRRRLALAGSRRKGKLPRAPFPAEIQRLYKPPSSLAVFFSSSSRLPVPISTHSAPVEWPAVRS
jgi:hypothetical protein